jgi:hypothetical protein
MNNLIIRTEDFSHQGASGLNINMPKQKGESTDPCIGCENRQRCMAEYLACDRYAGYFGPGAGYVSPSKYMKKPNNPSRAKFVELFGDDGLPPLPESKYRATKAEIREAIEAEKNTRYPVCFGVRTRQNAGTPEAWEAREQKTLSTLRAQLEELQGV